MPRALRRPSQGAAADSRVRRDRAAQLLLPHALLLRETVDGALVERREIALRSSQLEELAPHEWPAVTIKSMGLRPEIAGASITAIRRALANARPHRPGNPMMDDGADYYFFHRGATGRAQSPAADTEAGRLVRLFHALDAFVEGRAAERELSVAARERIGRQPPRLSIEEQP